MSCKHSPTPSPLDLALVLKTLLIWPKRIHCCLVIRRSVISDALRDGTTHHTLLSQASIPWMTRTRQITYGMI